MKDSKPNSDRRVEGEEGTGAHQEGPDSVQAGPKGDVTHRSTGMPDALRNDETRSGIDNSVADEEPGPSDDDGLPENARRRVPS